MLTVSDVVIQQYSASTVSTSFAVVQLVSGDTC